MLVVVFLALSYANGAAFMGPGEGLKCVLRTMHIKLYAVDSSHLIVDVRSFISLRPFFSRNAPSLRPSSRRCVMVILSSLHCATVFTNYQSYSTANILYIYLPCPTQILLVSRRALQSLTTAFVAVLVTVGTHVFALIIAVSDRMKPCFITYIKF